MKKLTSREKALIGIFVLIVFFVLFGSRLNKIGDIYSGVKKFIVKTAVITFSDLNKEERISLYKNDELFCLVDEDCTSSGRGPCLSPINKYYLNDHIKDYPSSSQKLSDFADAPMTDVYCVASRIICKNRKCIAE